MLYCDFSNRDALNTHGPFMMANRVGLMRRKGMDKDIDVDKDDNNSHTNGSRRKSVNPKEMGLDGASLSPTTVDMDIAVKRQYVKQISNLGGVVGRLGVDLDEYDPDEILEAMIDNDVMDDDMDDLSLTSMMLDEGGGRMDHILEPPSPRTNFIMNCINSHKNPMASLIVRKKLSKTMNLNHYGFGNDMALLISENLSGLPFLESVNLADNNLNDAGLVPLMRAVVSIPTLLNLDLSLNSFGMDAANLLGDYLESPQCTLERLRLRSTNLDDFKVY